MAYLFKNLLLLLGITWSSSAHAHLSTPATEKKRVLFICTSTSTFNGVANGTLLSELCVPFILFHELGYEIDIVSPKGGAIPLYNKLDTTEVMQIALNSSYYQNKVANSIRPQQVHAKDYVAVIIPDGYGQFSDVQSNEALHKIIGDIYANEGFIGTIGHGASCLVSIKNKQGDFLVKEKTITCFPSWLEKKFFPDTKFSELLPFDTEEELKKRGADLKPVDPVTYDNREIIDSTHRMVTAAFNGNGAFIVESIYLLLQEQKH